MLKKIILMLCLLSTTTMGADIRVLTPFSLNTTPTEIFYQITDTTALSFGYTFIVPANKGNELKTNLNLGVETNLPLLGKTNTYLNFDKGIASDGANLTTETLNVTKTWAYPLTDKIDIGIRVKLLKVQLEGTKWVTIVESLEPVVGATIGF